MLVTTCMIDWYPKTLNCKTKQTKRGFGSRRHNTLSTVATGDEMQDLLHFKNDGQLRTLNRCHSLPSHQK